MGADDGDPHVGKQRPEEDPGAGAVPPGRDDDDLADAELAGVRGRVRRVLGSDAGVGVAERGRSARPARPGASARPPAAPRVPRPAGEEDDVALARQRGGVLEPGGADRVQLASAPVGVAEDDDSAQARSSFGGRAVRKGLT